MDIDGLWQEAENDYRFVRYVSGLLPQDLAERMDEDTLYYFWDALSEYEEDQDAFKQENLAQTAAQLVKLAKKEQIGSFSPEELLPIVRAYISFRHKA